MRKYLEQYDSKIGDIIDNPESRSKITNRVILTNDTKNLFRTGQILGYCIFKISRRELDKGLLDLEDDLNQESLKNNWLIL